MASRTIESRTELGCSANAAWATLLEPGDYGVWGSRLRFLGARRAGLACLQLRPGRVWIPLPVVMQSCDEAGGVCWKGGIPGVITGRHYFRIESDDRGRASLVQGEEFRGILTSTVLRLLGAQLNTIYDTFNREFASRVGRQPAR